jgi:serine-type D-Ala-D-Ala endopeptidase (penicillin-binding protein 7)
MIVQNRGRVLWGVWVLIAASWLMLAPPVHAAAASDNASPKKKLSTAPKSAASSKAGKASKGGKLSKASKSAAAPARSAERAAAAASNSKPSKRKATAKSSGRSAGHASLGNGKGKGKVKGKGQRVARQIRVIPAQPSVGQLAGLHRVADALELKSGVALVVDQDSNEVVYAKNAQAVLPIASLTKLMTALVVAEANLPLTDTFEITQADVDTERRSRSRLRVGTRLNREEMLHLALMSSENRAAHALGRTYPGGLPAFVNAMNRKARALGMTSTKYEEPTGLSSNNRSNARDLATLVKAAHGHRIIRDLSVSPDTMVDVGARQVHFVNTNRLVRSSTWDIGLQKTGYISEAGRCLVMQASLNDRRYIMVFLDSAGKYSRLGDAERVRRWLVDGATSPGSADTEAEGDDEADDDNEEAPAPRKLTS